MSLTLRREQRCGEEVEGGRLGASRTLGFYSQRGEYSQSTASGLKKKSGLGYWQNNSDAGRTTSLRENSGLRDESSCFGRGTEGGEQLLGGMGHLSRGAFVLHQLSPFTPAPSLRTSPFQRREREKGRERSCGVKLQQTWCGLLPSQPKHLTSILGRRTHGRTVAGVRCNTDSVAAFTVQLRLCGRLRCSGRQLFRTSFMLYFDALL